MRRRATLLASVKADLDDIFTYVTRESGSVSAGLRFAAELRRRCHELAALPDTARAET